MVILFSSPKERICHLVFTQALFIEAYIVTQDEDTNIPHVSCYCSILGSFKAIAGRHNTPEINSGSSQTGHLPSNIVSEVAILALLSKVLPHRLEGYAAMLNSKGSHANNNAQSAFGLSLPVP